MTGVIGNGIPGVTITSPLESNGGIPVNLQDQTSRMLDLWFLKGLAAPTTLSVTAVVNAYTITVAATTGFVAGCTVAITTQTGYYFGRQIGAVAGNVITLDTPIDIAYPAGSTCFPASRNMAVNGAVTPQIFQIGPVGVATGFAVDIVRVNGYIQDDTAADDSLFGGIAALSRGIVLRKNNGVLQNFWNAKTNGELSLICASDLYYTGKAPAGSVGIRWRNTFAGTEKHGVTVRLEPGEILELIVQDNLTGLEVFEAMAQGHFVTD